MYRPLRISFCPAGSENTASSRLRCYGLARELKRLGCEINIGINPNIIVDVLYVQKTVSNEIIEYSDKVIRDGGKIIFDLDDWGDAVPWISQYREAFNLLLKKCSVVTVDTEERKNFISNDSAFNSVKEIWVIPNPVDYLESDDYVKGIDVYFQEVLSQKAINHLLKLKGCWFGNALNLNAVTPYIEALFEAKKIDSFSIITNEKYIDSIKQKYPYLSVEAWNLKTFRERLRLHNFCILSHHGSLEDSQKNSNKMVAALVQGVLPIVSNTPAYSREAKKIGLADLIIHSPEDIVKKLNIDFINNQFAKLSSIKISDVFNEYFSNNIARNFLDKVETLFTGEADILTSDRIRLNLGCGNVLLPGYINVDVVYDRSGIQPDINCDIRNLTCFPDNYCDEILAVHVIEHFYFWEVHDLLKEWVRVLKPNGKLILETPNLITACEEFLKDPVQGSFPDKRGQKTMWCLFGDPNWKDPLMCHRWLYTPQSLANVMAQAGLSALEQAIPQFKVGHPRDMRIEGTLLF